MEILELRICMNADDLNGYQMEFCPLKLSILTFI